KLARPGASPSASAGPGGDPVPPRVLVLMSSARSWKPSGSDEVVEDAKKKSVLGRYLPFVFNFLSATSDGALIDVFEDDDGAFKYDIPMRAFPIAADQLGHFFAFVEPSFRTFDFYQGMVDAEELIAGHVAPGTSAIPFVHAETFECFREYRRLARAASNSSVPALGPACTSVDANLGALLQASALRRQTAKSGDDDLQTFVAALQTYKFRY